MPADVEPSLASWLSSALRNNQLSPRQISEITAIPEDTIKGWLSGRGRSIREWERAIVLAAALDLTPAAVRTFFQAANVSLNRLEHARHVLLSPPYRETQSLVDQWLQRYHAASEPAPITISTPEITPSKLQPKEAINVVIHPKPKAEQPNVQPHRRWTWPMVGILGCLIAGLGLFYWLQQPQSSVAASQFPWSNGDWGTTDDRDYGGSAQSHSVPFVCASVEEDSPNPPIIGCMGVEGSIQDREGFVSVYRTLAKGKLETVDLSGYRFISFFVRGKGSMVHFGLEEASSSAEATEEHSATFTLTEEWQQVRIPLDGLIPLQPSTVLDLTHVRAVSWSIINGPQPDIYLMIDRVTLER